MIYAICNPIAGSGRGKIIGEIIEKGIVINASNDWKGRGYPSLMLAIPINIHNGRAFEKYVATVVVAKKISERHRDGGIKRRNKAYVVDSINVRSLESKLSPSTQLNVSGNQRNKIPSSVEEALINIWNVNKKNIKISLDENGEPDAYSLRLDMGTEADAFEGSSGSCARWLRQIFCGPQTATCSASRKS